MALVDRINSALAELRHRDQSLSINDWAEYFTFGGNTYPVVQTTMGTVDREQVGFTSVAGFKGSGPIFSLVLARLQVFSQVRFQWTRFAGSQPTELFGTPELAVLERPWHGGTTSDLLARMEVYASVAGCAFVTRPRADRLSLLRPDRVIIIMGSETDAEDPSEAPDAEIIGYVHETSRGKMTFYTDPRHVAYYAPIPDPDYRFLGMSWITPVIRDLQADSLATEHKARFFVNSATPNLAIKFDASIAIEKVKQFKEMLEGEHRGAFKAWKTLYLGGGADPVTVGNSFKDMDYAVIQGRAESRLASAAGVPPSWVGFAEGLSGSSLNAGNFNSARRRFSDGTMIHLWGSAATSLEVLLDRPSGATLWYDPRVPFMREDAGDLADIQQKQASTITMLVREGFTDQSSVAAVTKNDFGLLVHTGMLSVQLQRPGAVQLAGEQVPKVSAPDGARSFYPRAVPMVAEWDDDPIGDLDEDTLALLQALSELDEDNVERAAKFDPARHPRGPDGRFLSTVDRLVAAIKDHKAGKGKGDPFDGFDREQLRKAAKARGIPLKRGEDRDSIAAKLLADLSGPPGGKSGAPAPAGAAAAATPTVKVTPGPPWGNGQTASGVEVNGIKQGIVVHTSTGDFVAFADPGVRTPGGNEPRLKSNSFKTEQDAVDALVGINTPSKVSGPGLAGLSLAELSIRKKQGAWGPARASFEISHNGTPIGTVHNWGYGWTVERPNGGGPTATMNNKSQAIATLAGIANISPASKAIPTPPALPQGSKHGPEIQGALDILYGKDPKGHTMARQLDVYGSLRRYQFDQLGVAERQTILADLAYIETNSKSGPSATRASKLIDRFTPSGTQPGTMPTPSAQIVGPASGKQTRLPSPRSGLLRQATNSGARGDAWIGQGTSGGPVWGQYGAGGLLLRHVDDQGVERFLLTQRGPAISDPGKWSYPGGAFESLEDFYQGATREFAEELGFTDADFAGSTVHGYHVFERPDVTTKAGKPWTYHSVAATVPVQLKPNLSTHGARAETSDAKWMTRDEIAKLDKAGKLHGPVAGGKLQANVMSLFSSAGGSAVARPGPVTKRPARLTGTPTVSPPTVKTHKPSLGRNLVADQAARDQLRQDVKNARRTYAGKTADDRLAAIAAIQGFDDVPTVVTKDEFDDLLKTGNYIEAFRGQRGAGSRWTGPTRGGSVTKAKTAAQVNEEFRSGPAYYGTGIYGNGYYFATDKGVAKGYSDGTKGSILRVLIPKKANTVEHSRIRNEAQASGQRFSKAKGASHETATLWDEGRYAAAKGHDAIEIKHNAANNHVTRAGKHAYNVLNRSVLIVEEAE